jgi:hypothetical protein
MKASQEVTHLAANSAAVLQSTRCNDKDGADPLLAAVTVTVLRHNSTCLM